MKDSRTLNTSRNIVSGLINRIISIILPFINRTIIIYTLGVEFTGLSSLFTSILSVLSIAELGFNTAIIYSMYKPIAEKNDQEVRKLLVLYKKIYFVVGFVILMGGAILLPFIPRLINGEIPNSINIYILFLLYLINTVISYFMFSYKESILLAYQRQDISNNIRSKVLLLQYVAQAIMLLVFKDYYLFLVVAILSTLLTNILLAMKANKYFPQYRNIKFSNIGIKEIPKDIKKNVGGLLIGKISDQARNSFDSIILSIFFGLTTVGIYNNYYYIYSALYGIMLVICNSMGASVGNSIVTETKEKNYNDCIKFSFGAAWISGWISICMLCLYQVFMKIWVGERLLLSNFNMFLFCLYFYVINMNNIRNQYSSGNGLWWNMKYIFVFEAISNIFLNIVLAKIMGITGIILATIITIFVFNFVLRTKILFRDYFCNNKLMEFFKKHFIWFVYILITAIITYILCSLINCNLILKLFLNGIICLIVPNVILFLFFKNSKEFIEWKEFIRNFIVNIRNER